MKQFFEKIVTVTVALFVAIMMMSTPSPAAAETSTPPGPGWTHQLDELGWWRATTECGGQFINTTNGVVTRFASGTWYGIHPRATIDVYGQGGVTSLYLMGPSVDEPGFRLFDNLPLGGCAPLPTVTPSVTPTATVSATPTVTPTVGPSVTALPTVKPTSTIAPSVRPTTSAPRPTASVRPSDGSWVYTTPGYHEVNGRRWHTICEPYSQIERCFTNTWATQVTQKNGRFVQSNGWVFNNLTYTAAPRSLWRGNPLGANGVVGGKVSWVSDGRQWHTECDTATTGRGGCRSYTVVTVIEKYGNGFRVVNREMFNNMVRFTN